MRLYSIFDKVQNKFISMSIAETDEMFVRTATFPALMDRPLNDIEFYCVGLFDDDLGLIKPCHPRLVALDCYKFPVSLASKDKFLTIEQIDECAKNKKHEFLKQTKDKVIDGERFLNACKVQLKLEEDKPKKEQDKKKIKELRELINQTSLEIKQLKEAI